ncbi:serine/threonine-protein kinase unc-51 [Plectosphaerella plurivora]|uniref:non-specific serine/threonine protein kinase n=1 Tax=Plectosphaerella plurivora TaxID=936078 RepID=A0A9P8VJZ7_9PEZI|nr:serine/threonine-protein kinase unc-51 [Plectosphaerella plurivora]
MSDRLPTSSSGRRRRDDVGDFWVDSEIGKGSFATVYRGYHKASKALVAIKSVELGRLNKKLRENLYGEIDILKSLRHPHIVALHDCVESSTHINLVMEYCELGDLSMFIKKRDKLGTNPATHEMARKYPATPNGGLHEVVTRHFLQQLGSALKFLRASNYVHRDVKPQNLLLLPPRGFREVNSRPILSASRDSLIPNAGLASLPMLKLADFGFARVLPSTSLADTLCGSPLYMAPEILGYQRYDAKADLWSVGTVLFEMITGRPPFRAGNHVQLLKKIEEAQDRIRYPKDAVVSKELARLIGKLLTRNPVQRMKFEDFFDDPIVAGPIPGVVEDDIPKPELSSSTGEPSTQLSRRTSTRRKDELARDSKDLSRSPRELLSRSPQIDTAGATRHRQPGEAASPRLSQSPRLGQSPRQDNNDGLGIRRPAGPQPSVSAPARPHRLSNASATRPSTRPSPSPPASLVNEPATRLRPVAERSMTEQEKAAQDIAFERDYVLVEKKHVEVNAFADEMAANRNKPLSPQTTTMVRRATQQGGPTSTTGAVRAPSSQAVQIAQGRERLTHERRNSYERGFSASPGSAPSFITKAIQDASVRLFGYKIPHVQLRKGQSPPQMYSGFPTYPTPPSPLGLLEDGSRQVAGDEDASAGRIIEELAHRSDCVYGFGEVKYKQLIPLAPSTELALGGVPADELSPEDNGLTPEAVVVLSEEALVLYVKALTLLAKAMDVASVWWSRRNRDGGLGEMGRESQQTQRMNSTVQWVRSRFNEVLEKTEIVRLKLVEAQKQLPDDHPSHPNNHGVDSIASATSGTQQVYLTPGISAEKLMYDRALEMSKGAAIDEIANVDLEGCVISYVTAIYMLEAVLDNDDDAIKRRYSTTVKEQPGENVSNELTSDDQEAVSRMISMIRSRLAMVNKKLEAIREASRSEQRAQKDLARKYSGDVTPRSVPSHAS